MGTVGLRASKYAVSVDVRRYTSFVILTGRSAYCMVFILQALCWLWPMSHAAFWSTFMTKVIYSAYTVRCLLAHAILRLCKYMAKGLRRSIAPRSFCEVCASSRLLDCSTTMSWHCSNMLVRLCTEQMLRCYWLHRVRAGQWLGPWVLCHTLEAVVQRMEPDSLNVHVHVVSQPGGAVPVIYTHR